MIVTETHYMLVCDRCDDVLLDFDTPVCEESPVYFKFSAKSRGWMLDSISEIAYCGKCLKELDDD